MYTTQTPSVDDRRQLRLPHLELRIPGKEGVSARNSGNGSPRLELRTPEIPKKPALIGRESQAADLLERPAGVEEVSKNPRPPGSRVVLRGGGEWDEPGGAD